MATHAPHKPHRTQAEEAEEDPEPGMLPVEPDAGAGAPMVPAENEHDRHADPEA